MVYNVVTGEIMKTSEREDDIVIIEETKPESVGEEKLTLNSALNKYYYPKVNAVKASLNQDQFFANSIKLAKKSKGKFSALALLGKITFSVIAGVGISALLFTRVLKPENLLQHFGYLMSCVGGCFVLTEAVTLSFKGISNRKKKKQLIKQIETFKGEYNSEKEDYLKLFAIVDKILNYKDIQNLSYDAMLQLMMDYADMNSLIFHLTEVVYGDNLNETAKKLVAKYKEQSKCYKNPKSIIDDLKSLKTLVQDCKICELDVPKTFDKKQKDMLQSARESFAEGISSIITFVQVTNSVYVSIKNRYDKEEREKQISKQIKQNKEEKVFEDFLKEFGVE